MIISHGGEKGKLEIMVSDLHVHTALSVHFCCIFSDLKLKRSSEVGREQKCRKPSAVRGFASSQTKACCWQSRGFSNGFDLKPVKFQVSKNNCAGFNVFWSKLWIM